MDAQHGPAQVRARPVLRESIGGTLVPPMTARQDRPIRLGQGTDYSSTMSIVHSAKPTVQRSAPTAQPLLLGTAVRLRGKEATTGVIIAYASDSDRVRVRWDDTGEVTHCLRANLVARGVK
jgi:hypothetical protein